MGIFVRFFCLEMSGAQHGMRTPMPLLCPQLEAAGGAICILTHLLLSSELGLGLHLLLSSELGGCLHLLLSPELGLGLHLLLSSEMGGCLHLLLSPELGLGLHLCWTTDDLRVAPARAFPVDALCRRSVWLWCWDTGVPRRAIRC